MNDLESLIKDEILSRGPITFERFMELALYHPELGYYGSGRVRIGRAGDFYTSPHATPVFGALAAETFLTLSAQLGRRLFVEMGAGEGYFARDFITSMRRLHAEQSASLEYVIIERSAAMAARQREVLGGLAEGVRWHETLEGLGRPVEGVFFSNELVDAFPFHRVRREGGALRELYVALRDGEFAEVNGPPSDPALEGYFGRLGIEVPEGMTTEINLNALAWARSLCRALGRGFAITIDYGYTAREYYSPERSGGTMLCYRRHTATEDPYSHIGGQDITAHVDFSSLALEAEGCGMRAVAFAPQSSFLLPAAGWLQEAMARAGATGEEFQTLARGLISILHPDALGVAFKALVFAKGDVDAGALDIPGNMAGELGGRG